MMNAYELSELAGCGTPDSLESPGAEWLVGIHEDWHEAEGRWAEEEPADVAHELADMAIYNLEARGTHGKWLVFVDLAAYSEDIEDLGCASRNLSDQADVALYIIAERLLFTLCDEEG